MGLRKTTAVIFIILFLGYYQQWLYAPIIEVLSGPFKGLDSDPRVPQLINQLIKIKNEQLAEQAAVQKTVAKSLSSESALIAQSLSQDLQRSLEIQQRSQNVRMISSGCKTKKLVCGPPIDCSIGCQIHHVMTCVMIAYLSNRSLVVDWDNWPYKEINWSDIFLPIGLTTDCTRTKNSDISTVLWTRNGLDLSYPEMKIYPFKAGLPVPFKIGGQLKTLPTIPLLWWNGQFAQFVLRLQLTQEKSIKRLKNALKLSTIPTIGILIRKRDKLSGKKGKFSTPSIDSYITAARKYFSKMEFENPSIIRRLFIATDDKNVIKLIRKRYRPPKWQVIGSQLKNDVEDIVKDVFLLAECDFVICSFSNDICRLVLELKEASALNSSDLVKPIDQNKYLQSLPGFNKLNFLAKE